MPRNVRRVMEATRAAMAGAGTQRPLSKPLTCMPGISAEPDQGRGAPAPGSLPRVHRPTMGLGMPRARHVSAACSDL